MTTAHHRTGKTKKQITDEYRSLGRKISMYAYNTVRRSKKCFYCKKPMKAWDKEVHHLKPIKYGGSNNIKNLVCVHKGECHQEMDKRAEVKYGGKVK